MSDDDFFTLVAELVTPSGRMASDCVADCLAQRVLLVVRGQKEPEGASERIWAILVREEADKQASERRHCA
ncbi:MAG: hypothetical protein AAFX06_21340 [Planctomycetota bacterium]